MISGEQDSLDSKNRLEGARLGSPAVFDAANDSQLNRVAAQGATASLPPNFFLQTNEEGASWSAATQEASYGGAFGAKNIHNLQSYGKSDAPYDNNAYAITSVYYGGQLEMYTSHPVPPVLSKGQPGIAMTQLGAWNLIGDVEEFRMGAAAYRNARDWARGQFDHATNQAHIGGVKHAHCFRSD
ncbi:hypothetical protein PWT90_04255 [Aphanocladium album]|nr:hypothetical protein PWT90_04255 [Aphanocladium album]